MPPYVDLVGQEHKPVGMGNKIPTLQREVYQRRSYEKPMEKENSFENIVRRAWMKALTGDDEDDDGDDDDRRRKRRQKSRGNNKIFGLVLDVASKQAAKMITNYLLGETDKSEDSSSDESIETSKEDDN